MDYNTYNVPDRIVVNDGNTGEPVADVVAGDNLNNPNRRGRGSIDIPNDTRNIKVSVTPSPVRQNNSNNSLYNVQVTYSRPRIYYEKKIKFLGITIKRKTVLVPAGSRQESLLLERNTNSNPRDDIPRGTSIQRRYNRRNNS